jgi:CubicO group peptidase (beta-lactamase class C family)
MAPLWEPGSRYVYHAFSYGHILGEVLRRADGRSMGRFIAEEIAGPLGADFFLGLPAREEPRVAETTEGPKNSNWIDAVAGKPFPQIAQNPRPRALAPNDRAWRAAEIPGANGMATAHALARIYGVLAMGGARDGKRIIGKQSIAEATHPRFRGVDANFGAPVTVAAGFQLENVAFFGSGPKSFGHGAWGGAVGFCDPEANLGFGYAPNRMLAFDAGVDARRKAIIGALYDCLL